MNTRNLVIAFAAIMALSLTLAVAPSNAQMPKPETVTISGKLIDLSCSAKGMVMMKSTYNAENNDHKTPDGPKEGCAQMCLKGGQPAGVFQNGKIVATLLANASINLYKWAAEDVEIQGFWAGQKKDNVKTFVPAKIRKSGEREWSEVVIAEMH